MDRLNWSLKIILAFEKERPLLFKENGKPLIDRDDSLISFDLRKIGIDGGIENDIWGKTELHVQTKIIIRRRIYKAARIDE